MRCSIEAHEVFCGRHRSKPSSDSWLCKIHYIVTRLNVPLHHGYLTCGFEFGATIGPLPEAEKWAPCFGHLPPEQFTVQCSVPILYTTKNMHWHCHKWKIWTTKTDIEQCPLPLHYSSAYDTSLHNHDVSDYTSCRWVSNSRSYLYLFDGWSWWQYINYIRRRTSLRNTAIQPFASSSCQPS